MKRKVEASKLCLAGTTEDPTARALALHTSSDDGRGCIFDGTEILRQLNRKAGDTRIERLALLRPASAPCLSAANFPALSHGRQRQHGGGFARAPRNGQGFGSATAHRAVLAGMGSAWLTSGALASIFRWVVGRMARNVRREVSASNQRVDWIHQKAGANPVPATNFANDHRTRPEHMSRTTPLSSASGASDKADGERLKC